MSKQNDVVMEAYETWSRNRTPANMSRLLNALNPTLKAVMATHGIHGDKNVELSAKAYLAKQIIERYDPEKASLSTFAYQSLQRVPRIASSQRSVVHTPESASHDLMYIRRTIDSLRDKLDREPTIDEVADESGVSINRIGSITDHYGKPVMSSSKARLASGVDAASGDELQRSAEQELWQKYTVDSLDDIDRKIYDNITGDKPKTKVEVAKELGMSPSAVTQRSNKIIHELDSYGDD
jgi:DNA-directed RNA polymerase specialized sigma subunit